MRSLTRRLHESLGFRRIGVHPAVGFELGRWHDVGGWLLALGGRTGVPARRGRPGSAA